MESPNSTPVDKNYVLVVDNNGDTDIFNLSYGTSWENVSVMLQIKFGHASLPIFTYTDEEEDVISLDSQEAFEEAIKIAKKNNDVLHVQMRNFGTPVTRSYSRTMDANKSTVAKVDVKWVKTAVGNTVEWVKSTFNRRLDNSISEESCKKSVVEPTTSEPDIHVDRNTTSNPAEESDTHSVVNEEYTSDETSVKGPVESMYSGEISVPTSLMTEEDDAEVVVKMPIASTSQQCNLAQENTSLALSKEVLRKLKEEVRMAISQELSAFKEELNTSVVQRTDGMTNEGPRSPRQIKDEIKLLRKEMKEAKQLKKLNKQRNEEPSCSHDAAEESLRKYAASFICENLIDGSRVMVGQQFVKYWVLKNEGTSVWDHLIELKFIEESPVGEGSPVDPVTSLQDEEESLAPGMDTRRHCLWGPEKLSIPMPIVEMKGTAVIAVSHTAPSFPCTYTSVWRLSHNGRLFGPSIWCSVEVKSKDQMHCEHLSTNSRSFSSAGSICQETDPSFVVGSWTTRKVSVNEEVPDTHSDKLSDMLSFEMTAVADFNKATGTEVGGDSPHNLTYAERDLIPSDRIIGASRPEPVGQVNEVLEASCSAGAVVRDELEELVSDFESIGVASYDKTPQGNEVSDQKDQVTANEDAGRDQGSAEKLEVEEEEEEEGDVCGAENGVVNKDDEHKNEEISENPEERFGEVDEVHDEGNEKIDEDDVEKKDPESDDDDRSSVMSEFEVIPIPECFDTTRPLARSEDTENKGNTSTGSLQDSPVWEEVDVDDQLHEYDEEVPKYEDVPQCESQAESDEDDASETEEGAIQSEETTNDVNRMQTSVCEPEETRGVLVPQSIPYLETSIAPQSSSFTPGQVIALGTACSVTNNLTESNAASYSVDSVERFSYRQPVPLPRNAVDATHAEFVLANETLPFPQPRSAPILPHHAIQSDSLHDQGMQVHSEEIAEFILASESHNQIPASPTRRSFPIYAETSHIAEDANNAASPPQSDPEPYNPSPMEQLVEMGFFDIEMNRDLLQAFEGDMTRVVNALVHRATDDGDREDGTFIA